MRRIIGRDFGFTARILADQSLALRLFQGFVQDKILDDEDFIQACVNADPVARRVYREESV